MADKNGIVIYKNEVTQERSFLVHDGYSSLEFYISGWENLILDCISDDNAHLDIHRDDAIKLRDFLTEWIDSTEEDGE